MILVIIFFVASPCFLGLPSHLLHLITQVQSMVGVWAVEVHILASRVSLGGSIPFSILAFKWHVVITRCSFGLGYSSASSRQSHTHILIGSHLLVCCALSEMICPVHIVVNLRDLVRAFLSVWWFSELDELSLWWHWGLLLSFDRVSFLSGLDAGVNIF